MLISDCKFYILITSRLFWVLLKLFYAIQKLKYSTFLFNFFIPHERGRLAFLDIFENRVN